MRRILLALILLAGLVIFPAWAAGITMSADSSEYYFSLGEQADIPLGVTSSYDHDITGTIQFTTTEQLQNAGTVMMSTKNRVYTHTIVPGESQIGISAGTSDDEKSVRVQVTYDYTDISPVQVTLPEIVIHFVAQPPQSGSPQSPVTSTSAPGTGNVPSSSSVQIVQQSVSVQQQAGRDGTVQQSLPDIQQAQDANALKEQLQKEAARTAQAKDEFLSALDRDPLLASVNESLAADGFFRVSQITNPESGTAGTFSMEYRDAAGEAATVTGTMETGVVPSVTETSAAPVNVTVPLASNTSYQSIVQQLGEHGFSRNGTAMNISAAGSTVNITYLDPQGRWAVINATTDGKNVTRLTFATEPAAPFDFLPITAAIITMAVLLVIAWALYRRYRREGTRAVIPARFTNLPDPFDHRKAARELLDRAGIAYTNHQYADAYGMAGQALRLFLSCENGARYERTNTELIAFLRSLNRDSQKIHEILDRCSDVEFAKGMAGEEEFPSMVAYIRSLVDGTK